MELTRLQHIVAVARTASFSRAATEVCLTQPALSRSIAAFEARYGVQLFERRRTGITLTPAGRMVVEQAQAILSATRELQANLGAHAEGEAGEVRIGTGQLVASLLLTPLTERMLATRPGLSLRARIGRRQDLLTELAEDRLELLLANPGDPDILIDFSVQSVARFALSVLVRAEHPLAHKRGLKTSDLMQWPVAAQISQWPVVSRQAGVITCEDHFVLRDIALRTDCYTCTARAFVKQELSDGRLVALEIADFPLQELEVAIMRRRNRTPSPAAQVVEAEAARLLAEFSDA